MIQKYIMIKDDIKNYHIFHDNTGRRCLNNPKLKFLLVEYDHLDLKAIIIAYKDVNNFYAYSLANGFTPDKIEGTKIPEIDDKNLYRLEGKRILLEHDFISYNLEDYKHLLSEFLL